MPWTKFVYDTKLRPARFVKITNKFSKLFSTCINGKSKCPGPDPQHIQNKDYCKVLSTSYVPPA